MPDLIQLYRWTHPESNIHTINGAVKAADWMKAEADRINSAPGRVAKVRRQGAKVGVFVNDITNQHPKHSKNPK